MRYRKQRRGWPHAGRNPDLKSALDAMTAEELRAFLCEALERLEDEPRGILEDALMASAAKGSCGWKPPSPSEKIVAEVKDFVEAACEVGEADASDVDDYLRQGTKAFLARDYTTAREVFLAIMPPISDCTIDLGQHEMLDEVLTVSEHECATQYVVSVYMTTPVTKRVEALCQAIDTMSDATSFWSPLDEMEQVATEPLPDLDSFLPLWVKHLEQEPSAESDWESDQDRWLREAILRLEGVAGLEQIAVKTKRPNALQAWCQALTDSGDWAEALRAHDIAVDLVGKTHWRGEFLDGAALAAQELGRRDATKRLQAAWVGAPSLVRLLRWLGASAPTRAALAKRVNMALGHRRGKLASQVGLLHILSGDIPAAAKILTSASGLGWTRDGHPGHVLFPAFVGLLADGTEAVRSAQLFATLKVAPRDPMDMDWQDSPKPKLATPAIVDLLALAGSATKINSRDRIIMLKAMRSAATKRADGLLAHKRRHHYGHAATLVACCLEFATSVGKQKEIANWVASMRQQYLRFSAFQQELKDALASASL